jgi:hypothetical protein
LVTDRLNIAQPVSHPTHSNTGKVESDGGSTDYYKIPAGAKDLADLIEHKDMSFALGNIFKACYRLGEKSGNDMLYDINKIIYFAERLKTQVESRKA